MELKHKQMCAGCPWRKKSMAGWLGAMAPEGFVECIQKDDKLPCHCAVDYSDPNWKENLESAPYCVGALHATRKLCKMPRDFDHNEACKAVEPEEILSPFGEFQAHHNDGLVKSWETEV